MRYVEVDMKKMRCQYNSTLEMETNGGEQNLLLALNKLELSAFWSAIGCCLRRGEVSDTAVSWLLSSEVDTQHNM